MHVVFRSLLKIFEYAAKQACKQLQCNKAKLPEPASINGLHIHRDLGYASRYNNLLCTLDENIGGHIYTVTLWSVHMHLPFITGLFFHGQKQVIQVRLGPHKSRRETLGDCWEWDFLPDFRPTLTKHRRPIYIQCMLRYSNKLNTAYRLQSSRSR